MTRNNAIQRARELTMACWWPSRPYSSRADVERGPDWDGIIGELQVHADSARLDRCNEAEAAEYELVASLLSKG